MFIIKGKEIYGISDGLFISGSCGVRKTNIEFPRLMWDNGKLEVFIRVCKESPDLLDLLFPRVNDET